VANEIVIKVTGDVKDYVSKIKDVEKSNESMGSSLSGLTAVTTVAATAFAALSAAVVKGIAEFNESEAAVKELNQSMINAGTYTGELQNQYLALAGELQKVTKYADDQTISAISILQAYTKSIPVTEELVTATMNLATAKKIDLASAAELIGKTIDGETNALKRQGIEITNSMDANTRMADVITKINKKYDDYATKASEGSGQITVLKNATNDFLQNVGERFAPTINLAAKALAQLVQAGADYLGSTKLQAKETWDYKLAIYNAENALNQFNVRFAETKKLIAQGKELAGVGDIMEARIPLLEANLAQARKVYEEHLAKQADIKKTQQQLEAESDAKSQGELLEKQIAAKEASFALIGKRNEEFYMAQLDYEMKLVDQSLAVETDKIKRLQMLRVKEKLQKSKEDLEQQEADKKNLEKDLSVTAQMATSKNALISGIGKAASLRSIWIKAPENANAAYGAMVGIPYVGPALAMAASIASYAFSAEQAVRVMSAAKGGLMTGGIPGVDSIPTMTMPGELVVPAQNYEEVITSVAGSRSGDIGGNAHIMISLNADLLNFSEA